MAIIRRLIIRRTSCIEFYEVLVRSIWDKQLPSRRQARHARYRLSIEKPDGHVGKGRLKQGTEGASIEIAHAAVACIASYGRSSSGDGGGRCQHST